MKRTLLFMAAAVVTIQWLLVGGFVAHSYMWWMKANDYVITAGVSGTVLMLVLTTASVIYAATFYVKAAPNDTKSRVAALLTVCTGLTGQLVFWGMALSGVTILVHR